MTVAEQLRLGQTSLVRSTGHYSRDDAFLQLGPTFLRLATFGRGTEGRYNGGLSRCSRFFNRPM